MTSYFAIYFEDRNPLGHYPEFGYWNNYFVYEMPDYVVPKLNLQNIRIVPFTPEVAAGWKFAGIVGDTIKVRSNTNHDKQIPKELRVPYKPGKDIYYLTDENRKNGVAFTKAVMLDIAHRGFEQEWNINKPAWSKLYKGLPEAEALYKKYTTMQKAYGKRLFVFQQKIEECTTMQDCLTVLQELQYELNPSNYPEAERKEFLDVQRSLKSKAKPRRG